MKFREEGEGRGVYIRPGGCLAPSNIFADSQRYARHGEGGFSDY